MTQLGTGVNRSGDLISVDDAVNQFGISRSTIYRLMKEGLSKYRRAGDRKTYVSRNELQARLAFQKTD